jgi:hypothetical protein
LPRVETHLAEIRRLESELEEALLALDYAEQRHEPTFAPTARVAELQLQLDLLRGPVTPNSERRAAWLAHLSSLEECQTVQDGPAVANLTPSGPTPRVPQRPATARGASFELPVID